MRTHAVPTLASVLLVFAVGCTGPEEDDDTFTHAFTSSHSLDTVTDPDTDTETDPGTVTLPTGLYGQEPAANLPVPTFTEVLAMDGTPRTSADLVGHPTVIWFYPAAFTGG